LYENICKFKYSTIKEVYLNNALENRDNFVFYNLVNEEFGKVNNRINIKKERDLSIEKFLEYVY